MKKTLDKIGPFLFGWYIIHHLIFFASFSSKFGGWTQFFVVGSMVINLPMLIASFTLLFTKNQSAYNRTFSFNMIYVLPLMFVCLLLSFSKGSILFFLLAAGLLVFAIIFLSKKGSSANYTVMCIIIILNIIFNLSSYLIS